MVKKALILLAAAALWLIPTVALAADSSKPLIVVLVDRAAVHATPGAVEYARSMHAVASALDPDRRYAFVAMDAPLNAIGPVGVMDWEYQAANDEIQAVIGSPGLPQLDGQLEAFVEVHNFIGAQITTPGTEVFFLSGGGSVTDYGNLATILGPALSRFQGSGWPVHAVALPGSTAAELEFMGQLAGFAGGRLFHLYDDGLKSVADHILKVGASGTMTKLAGVNLESTDHLTSQLRIVPGTQETMVMLFRDAEMGDLRVTTPSGLEISRTDADSFLVVESPMAIMLRLFDPEPGQWQVETVGVSGEASLWQHAKNRYSLELASGDLLPISEKVLLVGHVLDGGAHTVVENTTLFATVTAPRSAPLVYELNDEGLLGDRRAADGYHSALIPPLSQLGAHDLTLKMTWPEFDHSISTSAPFSVQAFPSLRYEPVQGVELAIGERTKIATLSVHVQDQPYPVDGEAITVAATWPTASAGRLDIEPQVDFQEGTSWLYDVFLTPEDFGQHRFVFWLQTDYSGQRYTHGTGSAVLSLADPAVTASAPAPRVPAPAQIFGYDVLPVVGATVGGTLAALALVLFVYVATRTQPRGFLFNDRNELVVDFARLRRPPLLAMFSKDKIDGEEIGVTGFESVYFRFSGGAIEIVPKDGGSPLRVNNQPLMESYQIGHKSWIGTHGRLYTFAVEQGPAYAEASAD